MKEKITVRGLGVGVGIAIGNIFIYRDKIVAPMYDIKESEIEAEFDRFLKAIERSKAQILELQSSLESSIANILATHIFMLEDKIIHNEIKNHLSENLQNIEHTYSEIMNFYIKRISSIANASLAERVADIYDVKNRVLKNLLAETEANRPKIPKNSILVARNITPSDTLYFINSGIIGFVIETGGETSHIAILSKSFAIPSIFGVHNITSISKNRDEAILDAKNNIIILYPDKDDIENYSAVKQAIEEEERGFIEASKEASKTQDGVRIDVLSNLDIPEEAFTVEKYNSGGVGLYRTEFLYLLSDGYYEKAIIPTEDTHFNAYKSILDEIGDLKFTIRTLDLGGDKMLPIDIDSVKDENPFLGWRGIRFCLSNKDIFKTQLRAILRAALYGNISIMIPMVSVLAEILNVKKCIEECKEELMKRGDKFSDNIKIGALIEVPSAALIADKLAKHVDFFSIGSNDLVQYTLACDRNNDKVSYLYNPIHASVLKLIKNVIDAADKNNLPVTICGEMAGRLYYTPVLLGLGFKSLSMSSVSIPLIKSVIRALNVAECKILVENIMNAETDIEAKKLLTSFVREKIPFTKKV